MNRALAFLLPLLLFSSLLAGCLGPGDPVASSSQDPETTPSDGKTNGTSLEREVHWVNRTLPANAGASGFSVVKDFYRVLENRPMNLSHIDVEMNWDETSQEAGLGELRFEAWDESILTSTGGSSPLELSVSGEEYTSGEFWVAYSASSPSVHAGAEITIHVVAWTEK